MGSDSESAVGTERFCAARVRRDFLDFFAERDHALVPSAPVFPRDDPTLLFTNAGMNQFKDVFLGTGSRGYARAADTQKCIRVSGKHNDLEQVGRDTYHHTFFEMLGNWSFGDYFKAEAIEWAWELLTRRWGLPPERLWVTVFGGDEALGLPADEEAERLWVETAGIDPARVLRCGKADNFWEMGDTGPCGPCSEIHIDRGGPESDPADGADPARGVNAGNERFIELWNLVFIQFNRLDDGSLKPLPARHVDTGMGFERVLAVLQGVRSNYDTDLFAPLFRKIEALCGLRYGGGTSEADVAFRVIADHARAVSSALADGALPSNTGRGYVLRRLIRRAARFGRQALGMEEPFLFELAGTVAEVLGDAFPEIREQVDHLRLVVREEEHSFGRTLGRGLLRFEDLARKVEGAGARALPGAEAYELYATYGFPQDLIELMARERGLTLDADGWRAAHAAHQEASVGEGSFRQLLSAEQLERLDETVTTFHSAGEERWRATSRVVLFLPAAGAAGDEAALERLVLAATPFYPEAGGQVGDAGAIAAADGSFRFEVRDTQKVGGVVVHLGRAEGTPAAGADVTAEVDRARRALTRKNHTATHLMHAALKRVLGAHVNQQGSYVGPDRLRFDFSHPRGVEPEELERIEAIVNDEVAANAPVETTVEELAAAKARGVVALFGEKYGERVRVVDVGGRSIELCGGTHVRAAGDIGPFLILSERAIQAGVRRIEAITGPAAVAEIQRQRRLLRESARLLKAAPEELPERLRAVQEKLKEQKRREQASAGDEVARAFEELKGELDATPGHPHGAYDRPELDGRALADLGDRLVSVAPDLGLVLFGRGEGRVPFQVVCGGAARRRGLKAGDLARALGARLKGGGGGRPDRAQGQGSDPDAVAAALAWARAELARALECEG